MRNKHAGVACYSDLSFRSRNLLLIITNIFSHRLRNLVLFLIIVFFTGCDKEIIEKPAEPVLSIALTFDDGPDPAYTAMILNILKEKDVKATFFCVGNKMKKYPKITKRIFDEGHTIANHSTDHSNMTKKSFKDAYKNILQTEKIIDSLFGSSQKLFRPPWGKITKEQNDSLSKKGFKVILWNINSKDFADQKYSPNMILDIVIHEAQNNDIILFHDSDYKGKESRMNTVIALPKIIDILRSKGYVFKKAEELTNNNKISKTSEDFFLE